MEYQPLNTYIVKYSYPDYHFESEIGVFCDSAPCGTPPSEQKLKDFFADGDEPDIVEILVGCRNFLIETSVLSQETIALSRRFLRTLRSVEMTRKRNRPT